MEIKKIKLKAVLAFAGMMIMFLIGFGACGGQITKGPAEKPKEESLPPAEESEEGKATKLAWSYDPTGKRDPFEIPKPLTPPDLGACGNYYLDQMWIDGIIIGGGNKNIAHIILPNAKDCFVKVGDVIGANKGVVKDIRSDGIIVEEQFLDPVDPTKIRVVDKFLKMETESGTQMLKK